MNERTDDDDSEKQIGPKPTSKPINAEGYTMGSLALRGFLKLLVRCRRVILQDAAVLLHIGWWSSVLDNPVFGTTQFREFQDQVVRELDTLEDNRLNDIENIIPRIAEEIRSNREASDAQLRKVLAEVERLYKEENQKMMLRLEHLERSMMNQALMQSRRLSGNLVTPMIPFDPL
ncbi:hypothetical protein BGZ49_006402, partial [Haplosporangium sp. Z 27]